MPKPLPYGRQLIEDDDVDAVVAVLKSDFLTTGPEVPAFEAAFAEAVDARFAVACSSGTAGLHLAAMAVDTGPGTAVVVPSITFLATANAFRLMGAEVVFADVDPDTGLMTPATAREALARATQAPKAIVPVHLGGQTADMAGLATVADEAGAVLVEDACHALGTSYRTGGNSHTVGSGAHAVAAVFSLHPVKTVTAGEGGVVTTNDPTLAERLARFRNHGMVRTPEQFTDGERAFAADGTANRWYYEMPAVGLNYRLTDIQAALARSQLAKLPRFAETRQRLVAFYDQRFAHLASVLRPVTLVPECDAVRHLYQVLIDFDAVGLDRNAFMAALAADGILTQVHYIPVHRQPYYRSMAQDLDLPGADTFYARTLSLPLFAAMDEADAERVAQAVERLLLPALR